MKTNSQLSLCIILLLVSAHGQALEPSHPDSNDIRPDSSKEKQKSDKVDEFSNSDRTDASIEKSAIEESTDAEVSSKPEFDILEFRIKGNTLLPKNIVERAMSHYLGPNKTIDSIEEARSNLERVYKTSGYPAVIVNVPEQTVKKGIVKLEVVEGKISRVRVSGSRYHSLNSIKQKVPALSRGNVLYIPDVQEQLEQLNRNSPDATITPVLKPGRTPGTVEVELKVKDKFPLHGIVEINNQQAIDTTSTRVFGSVRYDNLFQKQHSLSLLYQTSPEKTDEVEVYSLTYMLPLANGDDRLIIYGLESNSDVSTLGGLNVIGDGQVLGARWIKTLTGTSSYFHNVSMGIDYKNFEDKQESFTTPISYWPLLFRYDGSSISRQNLLQFNVVATFGTPLNADQDEFTQKRFGSKTNFFYLTGGVSYKYSFSNGTEFRAKADMQLTNQPLISNEQFSAGGSTTVRGYYESQVLNDIGLIGSVELVSPRLFKSSKNIDNFRLLAFYDGATTDRIDPLPGETDRVDIASIGVGLRFKAFEGLYVEVDAAQALKSLGEIEKDDIRAHGKLGYEF